MHSSPACALSASRTTPQITKDALFSRQLSKTVPKVTPVKCSDFNTHYKNKSYAESTKHQ